MEDDFDNASLSIERAAHRHRVDTTTARLIDLVLRSRRISIEIDGSQKVTLVYKGCQQRAVLSSHLRSLVVDNLITKVNDKDFQTQVYSDDLFIIVRPKFLENISQLMQ